MPFPEIQTISLPASGRARRGEPEYRSFPNESGRNTRQAAIEVPLMVRALGLPAGGRVLEVGCGRGVALPVLARLLTPARLAGLDLDATLLDEARAAADAAGLAVELVPGDVRRMPFPDASFDLVVDFGTCYHIARVGQHCQVQVPTDIHEVNVERHVTQPHRRTRGR